jgi:hypothetical protein
VSLEGISLRAINFDHLTFFKVKQLSTLHYEVTGVALFTVLLYYRLKVVDFRLENFIFPRIFLVKFVSYPEHLAESLYDSLLISLNEILQ